MHPDYHHYLGNPTHEVSMIASRKDYEKECKSKVAEFLASHRVVLRHVRRGNKPIGSVIAFYVDGSLRIGFSKCNKLDPYNRHVGIIKAIADALDMSGACREIPHTIVPTFDKVYDFADSIKGHECLR